MLPPVRAISLFPEATTPAPQPAVRLRPVHATAANDQDAAMPVSGGRLGAMSLSVQLQLAQGLSIFAETIGALLKLPRGENEGLDDYARRITAAVEALDPPARAQLETALNQLVRGATLRLIADMLKDPVGPDAARLATLLENPQSAGKDLAATAAVTSYLQNEGRDARAPASAAPVPTAQPSAPTGAAPPPTAGSAASSPLPNGTGLPLPDLALAPGETPTEPLIPSAKTGALPPTAAGSVPAPSADAPPLAPAPALPNPFQAPTPATPAASAPVFDPVSVPLPAATTAAVSVTPVPGAVALAVPAINPAVLASLDAAADLTVPNADLEVIKAEATAVAVALAKLPLSILTGRAATGLALQGTATALPDLAEIHGPGETPISIPLRDPLLEPKAGRASGGFDANPVLAITEWLVENFLGRSLPPAAPASLIKPERSGADALIASLIAGPASAPVIAPADHAAVIPKSPGMPEAEARHLPAATELDALPTGSVAPARAETPAKAHGRDGLADTPAFILPAFVPREGVPLAFVPYPPAPEQRRERGGRKAQPVTKIDEEGEEPPPGGQPGYHGHGRDKDPSGGGTGNPEGQGNGDGGDALSQDPNSEGDANAQDFYWRMADWS
jgi:hypothetical protein